MNNWRLSGRRRFWKALSGIYFSNTPAAPSHPPPPNKPQSPELLPPARAYTPLSLPNGNNQRIGPLRRPIRLSAAQQRLHRRIIRKHIHIKNLVIKDNGNISSRLKPRICPLRPGLQKRPRRHQDDLPTIRAERHPVTGDSALHITPRLPAFPPSRPPFRRECPDTLYQTRIRFGGVFLVQFRPILDRSLTNGLGRLLSAQRDKHELVKQPPSPSTARINARNTTAPMATFAPRIFIIFL